MEKKYPLPMLVTVLAFIAASCTNPLSYPEEVFANERIDSDYFRSLTICEQIRIFGLVGSKLIDEGHNTVVVPPWVNDSIDNYPLGIIASCIADEGQRQLGLLNRMQDKQKEISSTIRALAYKAYNLNLLDNPEIGQFVLQTVCENQVQDTYGLAAILYLQRFRQLPEYLQEPDVKERMINELCE